MELDNKAVEALTSFGLTEYEAKVYLTLVTKGTQKASVLADLSNIPRPHVYSVIKLLHEKGLITIIPEKVNKYQALPLESVISKLLEDRMESIRSLENIGKELAQRLGEKNNEQEADNGDKVRLYNGRWGIIHLIREMLGRVNSTCDFITNETGFVQSMSVYEHEMATLKKRNAELRLLLPIEKETLPSITKLSRIAAIRHLDSLDTLDSANILNGFDGSDSSFLRVVVIDNSEVLFVRSSDNDSEESAIWTSQKELARMIRLMLDHMWRSAPDIDTKSIEIETGRKPERLTPIYGDIEVEKVSRDIMSRARNRVCSVLSQDQLIYSLNMFIAETRALKNRGIIFQLLVPVKNDISDASRARLLMHNKNDISDAINALVSAGAEVRHPSEDTILRMVLGDEEVVFNILGESVTTSPGYTMGVYTNHQETINHIQDYFNKLWDSSMDARSRLEEINRFINKEVLRDGEEGLRKYFERLRELELGDFSIKSIDPMTKKIVVVCRDPRDDRIRAKNKKIENICESGRDALRSFAQYIYDGVKMDCVEIKCVDKGDEYCEFLLYPVDVESRRLGNELLQFFESLKSGRTKENA
ncbi:hypothetical protein CUJ83_03130 [Methanocella sp. CWC-04]|uniref:Transcription regulator TrmB N-terminal domain-containing protein n=1 Tax=Methanooceanicella nereidis TaxID=2052831 RepID=A0AAP2RAW0_9EURY|nr:helix-turn-helix domain-containing protein [Methanocella sp. CWC-04]MCD1293988.1 hypothetical protein [Methanocella sp. CWC-04]